MTNSQLDRRIRIDQAEELLQRGQYALTALEFQEQAARYRAAASQLRDAMFQAERGELDPLRKWLEEHPDPNPPTGNAHSEAFQTTSHDDTLASQHSCPTTCLEADKSPTTASPWDRIERAAERRLRADTSEPSQAPSDLTNQRLDTSEPLVGIAARDSIWSDPEWGSVEDEERWGNDSIETIDDVAIADSSWSEMTTTDTQGSKESGARRWWLAPHVYTSLIAHVVLLFGLSLIVLSAAQKVDRVGIVAGVIEADSVLMETPLEFPSESESLVSEESMLGQVSLESLGSDLTLPSVQPGIAALETSQLRSPGTGAAGALGQGSSLLSNGQNGGAGSLGGSKLAMGADFFGVKATGNTFVYVIDSSPSMRRDGAFEAAKQEMIRSLTSMKPKQRYFINFFGKEVDPMTFENGVVEKYPVYATPENLKRTLQWMDRVQIQRDGYPPTHALEEAIAMRPDAIFLLFDGQTTVDVAGSLKRINRSRDILSEDGPKVPIHVVHFFNQDFQKQMRKVADENGGTYRFVPRPEKPRGKK